MRKRDPRRGDLRLEYHETVALQAGLELTRQRLDVIRELAGTEEHPDAETIFRAVQRRVPTVSLDAVYRTSWMLQDLGRVRDLPARPGSIERPGQRLNPRRMT